MENSLNWQISFYEDDNGTSPVRKFLSRLSVKDQRVIAAAIQRLRDLNFKAGRPLVGKLDNLHYLRVKRCTNAYRLIFVEINGYYLFLHVFCKKDNEFPSKDINVAHKRLEKHLNRL